MSMPEPISISSPPRNTGKLQTVGGRPRFATLRVIMALVLREMATSYGRSPGGYIWAILSPVAATAFISYIFSLGFRTPRLGDNFPIFFATGILPYNLFNQLSNNVAGAIGFSRALLAYPRVTYIDAIVARLSLAILTQLVVHAIILYGITTIWDTRTVFYVDRAAMSYAMCITLALGVGLCNCLLFTMYPLYRTVWSVATRPLFLFSGVLMLYETIPDRFKDYFWYNPVMHITGEMRGAFYLQYEAKYVTPTYVFSIAFVLIVAGLIFLRRYHRDMMER